MAGEAAEKLGVPSVSGTLPSSVRGGGASDRSDTTSEAAVTASRKPGRGDGGKSEDGSSKKRKRKEKEGKNEDGQDDEEDAVAGESKSKKEKRGKKEKKSKSKFRAAAAAVSDDDDAVDEDNNSTEKLSAKRVRIIIEPRGANDYVPTWTFTATPKEGWWGCRMFISAGCLDGMKKDIKASERAEFTEAQQEKLYHDAHAGKSQGKIGLGQRSGTMKIGGVKWAGKKVQFEEEVAVEGAPGKSSAEDDADGDTAADADLIRKAALRAVGSSTGLADLEAGVDSEPAASAAMPDWAVTIKWKKIISRALEAAPGGELKFKALRSAVTAAVTEKLDPGSNVGKAEVQAQVESAITSSSKFVVEGKRVKLKTAVV